MDASNSRILRVQNFAGTDFGSQARRPPDAYVFCDVRMTILTSVTSSMSVLCTGISTVSFSRISVFEILELLLDLPLSNISRISVFEILEF